MDTPKKTRTRSTLPTNITCAVLQIIEQTDSDRKNKSIELQVCPKSVLNNSLLETCFLEYTSTTTHAIYYLYCRHIYPHRSLNSWRRVIRCPDLETEVWDEVMDEHFMTPRRIRLNMDNRLVYTKTIVLTYCAILRRTFTMGIYLSTCTCMSISSAMLQLFYTLGGIHILDAMEMVDKCWIVDDE